MSIFKECPETISDNFDSSDTTENITKDITKLPQDNKIYKLFTSNYRDRALHLLTYRITNTNLKSQIISYINKNYYLKDKKIYDDILKILGNYTIFGNSKRGYNLYPLSKSITNWNNLSPERYLDVGCFNGDVTISVGNHFHLNKSQIHGIDIKRYIETDNFTYTIYNGICVPYIDESFDLITCFMVLHHIPSQNLDILLSEMYRVMKPEGLLIIREHNADGVDYLLLDVLHEYYDYVLNPTHVWEESQANYHTAKYWSDKITQAGFKYTKIPQLKRGEVNNIFNNYLISYKK